MGGNNCWVPGCGSCRGKGKIYFWKLPCTSHPDDIEWREKIENVIRKYRVVDQALSERMKTGQIFTCEFHFKEDDFEYTPTGRKKLKLYVVPSLNLPKKSHDMSPATSRPLPQRIPVPSKLKPKQCYRDLDALKKNLKCLKKLYPWTYEFSDHEVTLRVAEYPSMIPKYTVKVDEDMKFSVLVYNWPLPDVHPIYITYQRSLRDTYIVPFLAEFDGLYICSGVSQDVDGAKTHMVPIEVDMSIQNPETSKTWHRASGCHLLSEDSLCATCNKSVKDYSRKISRREKALDIPAKPNAPLSATHPRKVILALQEKRDESNKQKTIIERLQKEIDEKGVEIEDAFGNVIRSTMSSNEEGMSPFVKLMWEEQRKYHAQGNPRYHPMIIRFALSLALKSGSTYDELRKSGILILPSRRTLRDYKNAISPQAGFNPDVIDELKKKCENFSGPGRFVILSFDEVKIKSDLIFDKHTGRVIGFVDVGDEDINSGTFSDKEVMASHVLCFYVRDMFGNIKFNFGYFGTHGVLAHQLMPLFWKAVSILELSCNLMVIGAVCDGASANRKFINMHGLLDMSMTPGLTHRTVNLYAPDRFIWFFSDYPHLMKTARNCLSHSGFGDSFSRLLWNGKYLLWQHIREILKLNRGLKVAFKLRDEHVDLTSHSRMRVNLAVQTLSTTTAGLLRQYVAQDFPDANGTADFCSMMDTFFDIMNVRNPRESAQKIKPNSKPFTSVDDERFDWLVNVFLNYFDDWKQKIETLPGISDKQKEKMFISRQTMEGLKITVYSMIQCTRYLLQSGMPYVLTEKFCQDLLELYFGIQRACGVRADNPTLHQFGYNDNGIRMQGNLAKSRVQGNTKGGQKKSKYSWFSVSNEQLPKRHKKDD